jgi:mevalonate kinase
MKKTYYSNGKLLITGEYVVLDGALALALPTKKGQYLTVEDTASKCIAWKSYDSDGSIWFEAEIPFSSIVNKGHLEENEIKNTLIKILHQAYLLNPNFIQNTKGYIIETKLTFPKLWGLGTSSTLINNIAQWLEINAFELLKNSFGGSGYDIACAQHNSAIAYQLIDGKPIVKPLDFDPVFKNQIYFVYLNKKQNSRAAIESYYNKKGEINKTIIAINAITKNIIDTNNLDDFTQQIKKHEIALSDILEIQTVKEALFSNFEGVVKSLGAWGGDFVMVIAKTNPTSYFKEKGYDILIPYTEMIL